MQMIETALTRLLGIEHPILLAPMGSAAGGRLAAAVTHAGGLGRPATPASVSASLPGRWNRTRRRWMWRSTPGQRR